MPPIWYVKYDIYIRISIKKLLVIPRKIVSRQMTGLKYSMRLVGILMC
jgi:hypothetical protein